MVTIQGLESSRNRRLNGRRLSALTRRFLARADRPFPRSDAAARPCMKMALVDHGGGPMSRAIGAVCRAPLNRRVGNAGAC
jgi:hypothetical protein